MGGLIIVNQQIRAVTGGRISKSIRVRECKSDRKERFTLRKATLRKTTSKVQRLSAAIEDQPRLYPVLDLAHLMRPVSSGCLALDQVLKDPHSDELEVAYALAVGDFFQLIDRFIIQPERDQFFLRPREFRFHFFCAGKIIRAVMCCPKFGFCFFRFEFGYFFHFAHLLLYNDFSRAVMSLAVIVLNTPRPLFVPTIKRYRPSSVTP